MHKNETLANQNTQRVICRCSFKGCKYVKSFDVPTVERRISTRFNTFFTREASAGEMMNISNTERCPFHPRHLLNVRSVQGTLNPDHPCDARCTGARGHSCDCSCGGVNHGSSWL